MKTEIERNFFEIYQLGGIFNDSLTYIAFKFDIGNYRTRAEKRDPKDRVLIWLKEGLPKRLEQYDTEQAFTLLEPTIEEIRGNLDELEGNERKMQRYIYSLLTPFADTVRKARKEPYFEAYQRNHKYFEVNQTYFENNPAYEVFANLKCALHKYADRLDALLLEYGIDLLQVQQECGVKLKGIRYVTDVAPYIGTLELAQRLIDNLTAEPYPQTAPQPPQGYIQPTQQRTTFKIAPELQTEEAKQVLAVCEGVICNVKGKGKCKAIDTTTTPWSYASRSILRCVAYNVGRILQMPEPWKAFEDATGVKSLQSASDTQGGEVEQALRKVGYDI